MAIMNMGRVGLLLAGLVANGCVDDGDDAGAGAATTDGDAVTVAQSDLRLRPPPGRGTPGRGGFGNRAFRGHSKHGRHVMSGHDGRGGACGGGAGGHGGAPAPVACIGTAPNGGAITGSATTPAGGTYTYAAPNLTAPTVAALTTPDGILQGVHVTANPGTTTDPANSWSGLGLFFSMPACVDARAYTGVRFTITGNLGTCRLSFNAVPSEDNAVANGPVGTCTAATCISPSFGPVVTGTTVVHFADLSGGDPLPTLDAAALNDIGWQINVPTDGSAACVADFTITDVAFVNDTPRAACTGVAPASAVVTDFSDAFVTGPNALAFTNGGTFTYASAGLTPPALSLASDGTPTGQKLGVAVDSGTPPAFATAAWDGFGLYFNMCTDASRYSGIRFTIDGDVGACSLQFAAQFSENDDVAADPTFGSCTAPTCFSPWVEPVGAGTTTVRFADLVGGSPLSTVDTARLTGIHWQFMPPVGAAAASCHASFTIDDVAFVP